MNQKTKKTYSVLFFVLIIFSVYSEKITFHSDAMQGKTGSKSDDTKLIGNAFVKTETMEIKAENITLSGKDFRYILAEGAVEGINTEDEMTYSCGTLKYDRETKIAFLEDSVHMIDKKNNVEAFAQIIEYNQNTGISLLQINVKIIRKDDICTSAHAIYRKKEQTLNMSGNPKIQQKDDTFRAQEIALDLNTDEITLDGRVRGTVIDKKEENKENDKKENLEKK